MCSGRRERGWGAINTPTPERGCVVVMVMVVGWGGVGPSRGRAEVTARSFLSSSLAISFQLLPHSRSSSSSSRCRPSRQLIHAHSKSVWVEDQISPPSLFLSLSPSLLFSIAPLPLAAIMRGILSFVPAPMVHLASDMGTTGTGNQ